MTTTTPINALPSPDDSSPNDPPIHFVALANQLDTLLVPRFATTTARDNAITAPVDGMAASVTGVGTYVRLATWRMLPLGVVPAGAAMQTTPQSVSSATEVRVVGATNLQITLHANRAYRFSFTTIAQTDTVGAVLSVRIHGKAGSGVTPANTDTLIADGAMPLQAVGGPGGTTLQFSNYFTVSSSTTYVISPFIARAAGSGIVSINGNTRVAVEDVGDAANLSGFAQLT